MQHLGDFGTPRPANDATFGYFGSTLRSNPDLSDLAVVDLFDTMAGAGEDGSKAIAAIRAMGAVLVHPDDVPRFWELARANRQTMEDIANLATALIGAVTERPTGLPSDSSGGQASTAPRSAGDSSSRALELVEGRPDLQVVFLRQEAARQAG